MTSLWLLLGVTDQLVATRDGLGTPLLSRLMGVVGMATMIGIAWLMSADRRKVRWPLVGVGVALQTGFAVIVLKTAVGQALFDGVNRVFAQLLGFTEQGARFIFGNLARNNVPVGETLGAPVDMAPLQSAELWALGFGFVAAICFGLGATFRACCFFLGSYAMSRVATAAFFALESLRSYRFVVSVELWPTSLDTMIASPVFSRS